MGGGELWSSAPEEHPAEKVERENSRNIIHGILNVTGKGTRTLLES